MYNNYEIRLQELKDDGNFREIKSPDTSNSIIDLSSNDYLGIASNAIYVDEFYSKYPITDIAMSSSASRLLTKHQHDYFALEKMLSNLYARDVLIFNSGYHANTGIISALCDKRTLIVADKLVHASIIDGIILSRATFIRFRHNDYDHLQSILEKEATKYDNVLIISESIFSMDGDKSNLQSLVDIKHLFNNTMLYIDEAHGFGVYGNRGLGLAEEMGLINDIDIIVGTFGKAAASMGAFVVTNNIIKQYLINSARSFIFSTALPPISCAWTKFIIEKIITMDTERIHLAEISSKLYEFINPLNNGIESTSQIVPLVIGDSKKTLFLSEQLKIKGYQALPIRTPTVPKGTERIRFSLNASILNSEIDKLIKDVTNIL
ncbi:MAG: 8-amino-7-oxononanoate synthase [Muribaculaceae bacterium]